MRTLGNLDTGRRFFIAGQQRIDVVRAVLGILREYIEDEPGKAAFRCARLGQHRHVGRQAAAVRGARGIVVRERGRPGIGRPRRTLEHVAGVVRAVLHLVLRGERLDLRFGEFRAARLGEVAEGELFGGVAVRADFAEHLEAALQLRLVVMAEEAGERPGEARRLHLVVSAFGEGRGAEESGAHQARCDHAERGLGEHGSVLSWLGSGLALRMLGKDGVIDRGGDLFRRLE